MVWISALIYLKPNTKVIILKSKSYMHESIHLFNKIIEELKLNVNIIESTNNIIYINDISKICDEKLIYS